MSEKYNDIIVRVKQKKSVCSQTKVIYYVPKCIHQGQRRVIYFC